LYEKWESSSPTVKAESVLITSIVEAFEKQIVGVYDIPGAFLHAQQTDVVCVKMSGEIAAFLMEVSLETYSEYATLEKGKEIIYLQLKKSLYGCLKSVLLFWQGLSGRLKKRGYILNPYDSCVASKWVEESQLTLVWHVDDLKVSHKSEAVLDKEIK
jgi:hypothetical protein